MCVQPPAPPQWIIPFNITGGVRGLLGWHGGIYWDTEKVLFAAATGSDDLRIVYRTIYLPRPNYQFNTHSFLIDDMLDKNTQPYRQLSGWKGISCGLWCWSDTRICPGLRCGRSWSAVSSRWSLQGEWLAAAGQKCTCNDRHQWCADLRASPMRPEKCKVVYSYTPCWGIAGH